MIPVEGFYDIENMIITDRGLVRRSGLVRLGSGADAISYRVQDVLAAWREDGSKPIALITNKALFDFVPLVGATEVPWNYSAGTISVSGGIVTGSGVAFLANDIMAGDVVRTVDGEAMIDAVLDADELTLLSGGIVDGAGQSYYIQRGFGPGNNVFVDSVVVGKAAGTLYGGLVIADGKRSLLRWDPDAGTLAYWTTKNRNMLPQDVAWSYSNGTIDISGTSVTGFGTDFITGDIHAGDIVVLTDGSEGVVDTVAGGFQYSDGTLTVSGTTVTGSGTQFVTAGVTAGDKIRLADGTEGTIQTVTDLDSLVLSSATLTAGSGFSYIIYRPTDLELITLVADTLEDATSSTYTIYRPSIPFVPDCVAFFMDRIWVASTYDAADGYKRQRIRWSDLADTSDFSTTTNYIDLPYLRGPIIRLVPMGDRLVAYFTDGIFVGIPTNYPTLPLRFERVETGGIGLVGQKAVVPWVGGHFFVGKDGIYWLAYGSAAIEQVGIKIFDDALTAVSNPAYITATADSKTKSIIFGFPGAGETIEKLWYFHVVHKAWSTSKIATDCLAILQYVKSTTWDALTGTWDTLDATYPSWSSFGASVTDEVLVFANNGSLWIENTMSDSDYGTDPIPVLLETGDLDFDAPDINKIVTRFGIRVSRQVGFDNAIDFIVRGSTNKGRTWKSLGTIYIPAGQDEGKADFAISDSTIRFRLTSTTISAGYELIEENIGVVGLGDELALID
jgi:hypothetical protein